MPSRAHNPLGLKILPLTLFHSRFCQQFPANPMIPINHGGGDGDPMPYYPNVPRCQHLKVNGTQCGWPALTLNRFCFFHKRFQDQRVPISATRRRARATFDLPVLEYANAIQVSLMQTMRLLVSGQIDPKIAGLLLYALQTASLNLRQTRFEPLHVEEVVIDRNTIDQTCIGGDQWC